MTMAVQAECTGLAILMKWFGQLSEGCQPGSEVHRYYELGLQNGDLLLVETTGLIAELVLHIDDIPCRGPLLTVVAKLGNVHEREAQAIFFSECVANFTCPWNLVPLHHAVYDSICNLKQPRVEFAPVQMLFSNPLAFVVTRKQRIDIVETGNPSGLAGDVKNPDLLCEIMWIESIEN